ncbi:protein of unknown function [Cyclobacterium lianum]|uniref:Type IX secretion system membrane protein, PorP/SprF family n=1 Tax=Cyclobacterium lianum TaxID=388280 RepID=A0A1M7KGS9_9BACT|nr:DUF4421 domain-containing protein [Cyclobacterium lianum]SHM64492.1 protein of unknown function [Cyclobacterium lianum]
MRFYLPLFYFCFFFAANATGRQEADSLPFYEAYPEKLTGRFYFSRKYTGMGLQNEDRKYLYMPNSTLNMGVGLTYQNLTLNLATGFGFLNPERGRGESSYLDLQAHAYPNNLVIDLFGQFYNGYFLRRPDNLSGRDGPIVFPSMKMRKVGTSVQYLFNGDKFSYRAAFLQNEWQQKSAGSLLAGFEIYGGQVRNQNGILPPAEQGIFFDQIKFLEFGPNIGYAHSLIIMRHFFITLSATSSLALGRTVMEFQPVGQEIKWGLRPNLFLRGFTGYNSKNWSVNINYVYNQVNIAPVAGYKVNAGTGNYRLNIIYRFSPGPRLARRLSWVDELKDHILGR